MHQKDEVMQIAMEIKDQIFQNQSDGCYENIKKMSTHKALPLMIPSPEDVQKTLIFKESIAKPLRSLSYLSKQLKKVPLYIWVDKEPIPSNELSKAYVDGI